ncbi:MAG: formylglycine-generating enzyme family protein [Pseudomonadota bacterium]
MVRILAALILLLLAATAPALAETYTLSDGRTVETLETFQECDVCPEMVVLPLGSFTMGAPLEESRFLDLRRLPPGEPKGYAKEGPMHEVEIDIPIAMGRHEVTYDEWMSCVAEGGCNHTPPAEMRIYGGMTDVTGRDPVLNVSYLDIQEYLRWLHAKVGTGAYRLPTEAEWEYAARAGTTTPFAQGDRLRRDQAAFSLAATALSEGTPLPDPEQFNEPVPVDALDAANGWGLRHMAGNATEKTMSCWSDRHLGLTSSSQYLANAHASAPCDRVSKGGSFAGNMYFARPANRGYCRENLTSRYTGFRLLREVR